MEDGTAAALGGKTHVGIYFSVRLFFVALFLLHCRPLLRLRCSTAF